MSTIIRKWMLNKIEKQAQASKSQIIAADEKSLVVYGERIIIKDDWLSRLSDATGFFLSVPPNFYCVVLYPDGSFHELEKGFHSALPGEYQIIYVQKQERFVVTNPVSEITTDGEKFSLSCLVQFCVKDPSIAAQIDRPIELLTEYIETDIASYIRSHDHHEIASLINASSNELLLSFLIEKNLRRRLLPNAIIITNVEVKMSFGDPEFLELRRSTILEKKQIAEKERLEFQIEIERIKAQHNAEFQRLAAKTQAEKESLLAEISRQKKIEDEQNENSNNLLQRRHDLVIEAAGAIGQALESSSEEKHTNAPIKDTVDKLLATIRDTTSFEQGNEKIQGLIEELNTAIGEGNADIFFSAYYPKEGIIETWHTLLVYAYIKSAVEKIQEDVERFGNQIKSPKETTSKSSTPIVRGTEITVVPSCEGITFNPERVSFKWLEDFHRAEFRFRADRTLSDDAAKGSIDICVGPLIVGTLKFAMLFNDTGAENQLVAEYEDHTKMYSKDDVFISYSRKDNEIARTFKTVLEGTGLDVFLDVDNLRSGQFWEDELKRRIERAKIFQIFWSSNYSQSENCKQEWEYALKQKRDEGYIRPVFWEKPLSPKPPEELNKFNFKYVELKTTKDDQR